MKHVYSEKTDVWAFGVTMIEILNRQAPYPNIPLSDIIVLVVTQQINPLSQIPEWLSQDMKNQFTRCFAYDPIERCTFKVKKENRIIVEFIIFFLKLSQWF